MWGECTSRELGHFIQASLKRHDAWQIFQLDWNLCYTTFFTFTSRKSLAILCVTKAMGIINRKTREKKCFIPANICLLNLRILTDKLAAGKFCSTHALQSGNVKDISTSTSTIQGFLFYWLVCNTNMSIAPVVYIWELRNSVLPMLFQSGNVKDVHLISASTSTIQRCFFLLAGFNSNMSIYISSYTKMKDHIAHETFLRKMRLVISWIWLNGLHTYWVL